MITVKLSDCVDSLVGGKRRTVLVETECEQPTGSYQVVPFRSPVCCLGTTLHVPHHVKKPSWLHFPKHLKPGITKRALSGVKPAQSTPNKDFGARRAFLRSQIMKITRSASMKRRVKCIHCRSRHGAEYTNNASVQDSPSQTCEFHETGAFVANSDDERVNNTRALEPMRAACTPPAKQPLSSDCWRRGPRSTP